jgi:DNA-binding NarL/FixJ family response regulator
VAGRERGHDLQADGRAGGVGRPHREAVHGGVVERRHQLVDGDVLGEDAAPGVAQRHRGDVERRAPGQHARPGLVEGDHAVREGIAGTSAPPCTVILMPIRVVLAEDNYLLREGMTKLVELQPELELAGAAGDYDELLALIAKVTPDVVITDIRMPPTGTDEGIRAAAHLREANPGMGVVVLSQYDDPAYALALLEGGSQGRAYLLKERVSDVEQLLGAIREVSRGGSVIDPKVVDGLVAARSRANTSELDRLTPREREVVSEMAQGKSNAAIAATLVLTERAVEKHINSIFSKLGLSEEKDVNRRVKAVLLYLSDQGG